jgi:geranylgeranyl pyrophosphate synthase
VEAVKLRLEDIIRQAGLPRPLYEQASAVLAKAMRTYAHTPQWPVAELPRRTLAMLGGPAALGDGLAAAAVLFYAAADVIDDAQDGELGSNPAWLGWGWQEAVNTGNLLLFLSQQTLLTLEAAESTRLAWSAAFARVGVRMASGQARDFDAGPFARLTEAETLLVAEEKVGAYWGAIASLAPLWANRTDVADWWELGSRIGVLYQLMSDVWAYMTPLPHQDVAVGKMTLPLQFASQADPQLAELWEDEYPLPAEKQAAVRARVVATGAVTYGQMRVEILKKEAQDRLLALDCPPARELLLPLIEAVNLQGPISAGA